MDLPLAIAWVEKGCAMRDQNAFLQAIRQAALDDAPRLVYADWLEEQGQSERAAFIRVQCEAARLPKRSPRRKHLTGREEELLQEFEDQWLQEDLAACGLWEVMAADFPVELDSASEMLAAFGFWVWEFRRGFLAELRGTIEALLTSLRCLDRLPPLETLYLMGDRKALGQLLRWPGLAHVSTLRLHRWDDFDANDLADAGVTALARSANVCGLVSLSLGETGVGDAGVAALAASPHLPQLKELYLDGNERIGPTGAWSLARSPYLSQLQVLDLEGTGISPRHAVVKALGQRFGDRVSV